MVFVFLIHRLNLRAKLFLDKQTTLDELQDAAKGEVEDEEKERLERISKQAVTGTFGHDSAVLLVDALPEHSS